MSSRLPSISRERTTAALLLLGVVAVWGCTFALVKDALQDASPLLFNLLRMALASLALLAVNRRSLQRVSAPALRGGAVAGVLLGFGYQLQTAGLAHTTATKAAFLTGLVVVFVPLLSLIKVFRQPDSPAPRLSAFLGTVLAFIGLVLLTTPGGTSITTFSRAIGLGDLLILGCAVAFAGHLLTLSRLAELPSSQVATLQICGATLLMLLTLPLEGPTEFHPTGRLLVALLITALVGTATAFTIQTWAQRHLPATTAALILTLEPVFALVFSMTFLGERLSGRAASGAALILSGIAVTEVLALDRPAALDGTSA